MLSFFGLGINDSPFFSTSFCACVSVCLDNITSSWLISHLFLNSLQEISLYTERSGLDMHKL